jgi:ABC-2 type transport system ATP-binding protein
VKPVIQIEGLTKKYGRNTAVNNLSLSVREGEIFALLGANGAGKTTTLECVEGIRGYDSGSISIRGKIGVQLQSSSLPAGIKVTEAMRLFSKWRGAGVDGSLLAAFGLDGLRNKQYKDMSVGQKRRLHLALALIGAPDIIFLDEPTAGLDVEGRVSLHEEIRKLKARGKTIVMASHDMAEVEELCDRIAILKAGEIAFIGTVSELTAQIGVSCEIHIKTDRAEEVFTSENIGETLLAQLETYKRNQITVLDIKIITPSLEQRFMDIAKQAGTVGRAK